MPDLARAFGGRSFAHGTADLVEGGFAAAMWLPPGVDPDSERLVALAGQHAPRDRSADLMQVFEQMDAFHPADPCWYLPLIGVDPTYQGRGCGSALLKYALARCDRDGVAAYLESSNPRNIPLTCVTASRPSGASRQEARQQSCRCCDGRGEDFGLAFGAPQQAVRTWWSARQRAPRFGADHRERHAEKIEMSKLLGRHHMLILYRFITARSGSISTPLAARPCSDGGTKSSTRTLCAPSTASTRFS